jgi:hypothetical protein
MMSEHLATPSDPIITFDGGNETGVAPGASGNVLTSNGTDWISAAPVVPGTVAVNKGGTGATSLTAHALIVGNGTSAVNFIAPSTYGNVLQSDGSDWKSAVLIPAPYNLTVVQDSDTDEAAVAADDKAKIYNVSVIKTMTLASGSTLGDGWFCYIANLNTASPQSAVTVQSTLDTIDGKTSLKMYSGEMRLFYSDGMTLMSILLKGGYAKFTTSGTFVVPTNYRKLRVVCVGGGGQGSGGSSVNNTDTGLGGAGGGGGSVNDKSYLAAEISGSTVVVTIGAGGSGAGAGGTIGYNTGSDGANGGNTTFGSYCTGYGGSGGYYSGGSSYGGGGASIEQASNKLTSAQPCENFTSSVVRGGFGTTGGSLGAASSSEWGGAAGGSPTGSTGVGGSSLYAGAGGGRGGSVASGVANANTGAAGGGTRTYTIGTGANAGGAGTFTGPYCGTGGGGGDAGVSVTGHIGGAGGIGSGGGGGGASYQGAGGAGGNGGSGVCYVWYD